jgi:hypothetical protein
VSPRSHGRLFSVAGFTIAGGKVVEIDILANPERLSRLDLSAIEGLSAWALGGTQRSD